MAYVTCVCTGGGKSSEITSGVSLYANAVERGLQEGSQDGGREPPTRDSERT